MQQESVSAGLRLQKWIADLGLASRREAERWIGEGRVAVNGEIVKIMGTKVDPNVDQLAIDGRMVKNIQPPKVYWVLNKPDEVLTSRVDEFERPTIYDLACLRKVPFLVSPVGRLDYRTEGLLLLTNDGELNRRLCHPKYKVPRHYQVLITGKLSEADEEHLRRGVMLEDGPVKDIKIQYAHGKNLGGSRGSWYFVTIHEGRNRIVRRVFEALDHKVVKLMRYGFGELRLDETLKPGEFRPLTSQEIRDLKRCADLR